MKNMETYNIFRAICLLFLIALFLGLCVFELADRQLPEEPPLEDTIIEEPTERMAEPAETWASLGTFELTAYCPCEKCSGIWGNNTSTGATATEGTTIAVDPNVIPYGSRIKINDHIYIAQDCGGAIKEKRIDIYHESHEEAWNFGRQKAEVFIAL